MGLRPNAIDSFKTRLICFFIRNFGRFSNALIAGNRKVNTAQRRPDRPSVLHRRKDVRGSLGLQQSSRGHPGRSLTVAFKDEGGGVSRGSF